MKLIQLEIFRNIYGNLVIIFIIFNIKMWLSVSNLGKENKIEDEFKREKINVTLI